MTSGSCTWPLTSAAVQLIEILVRSCKLKSMIADAQLHCGSRQNSGVPAPYSAAGASDRICRPGVRTATHSKLLLLVPYKRHGSAACAAVSCSYVRSVSPSRAYQAAWHVPRTALRLLYLHSSFWYVCQRRQTRLTSSHQWTLTTSLSVSTALYLNLAPTLLLMNPDTEPEPDRTCRHRGAGRRATPWRWLPSASSRRPGPVWRRLGTHEALGTGDVNALTRSSQHTEPGSSRSCAVKCRLVSN